MTTMIADATANVNGWVDAERAAMRGAGGVVPIWLPNPWAAGGARVLNIGCGARPVIDAVNHDRRKHSPWVDWEFDLERMPWAYGGSFGRHSFDVVICHDIVEHMTDVFGFLNELHAMLRSGGILIMRGAAWDNPATHIDPTHKHRFHEDSMDFVDPDRGLGKSYGMFYCDSLERPLAKWHIDGVDRVNADQRWPDTPDICWTMVAL